MATASLANGIEIFHHVHGGGAPLLLIAGTATDHTGWGAQVVAYRRRYRTIVYDSRGTGRSDKPEAIEEYTAARLAEDAALLLSALGIESAHVAGLSMGSAVAQEMAIRHPDRVRSLQLHSTWTRADAGYLETLALLEDRAERHDWVGLGEVAVRLGLSPAFHAEYPGEARRLAQAHVALNQHPPTPTSVLGHLRLDRAHDSFDRLPTISCPTLVTVGEHDLLTPPHHGRQTAKRIPGAAFHIWEGPRASHLANMEMASEFNRVTLAWLERVSGQIDG